MASAERVGSGRSETLTGEQRACHGLSFPDDQNMKAWFVPPVVVPLLVLIMVAIILAVRSFA